MIRFTPPRRVTDLRALLRQPRARLWVFIVATGLLTGVALLLTPPTPSYNIGTVAMAAVKAPRSIVFVSDSLTEQERDRAAAAVPKQFAPNPAIVASSRERLAQALSTISRIRGDPTLSRDQKLAALQRAQEVIVATATATDTVDLTGAEWDAVQKELDNTLRSLYGTGIRAEQLDATKADAAKALPPAWNDRQKRVGTVIVTQFLDANVQLDAVATSVAQQAARNAVGPVQVQVVAGEVIVREGSVVTAQDIEKLRALGLASPGVDWRGAIGLLLWAILIAGVLGTYIERYATEAWTDDRKLALISLTLLALTAVTRALVPGHTLLVYFIPYAAAAMMLTVLVSGRAALATQIAGALHAGIMSNQVDLIAYVLVPALLGIAAVRRATTAREFAAGASFVAIGNVGVLAAFTLVGRATDPFGAAQLLIAAVTSAAGAGLLAFAAMAMIGHLFRITTVFELRELADPTHPLLRQLLLRTPGTYHHSLLVANLAERAAEVIGADPLLARVGAYYHDIGKMRNPSAFIENQTGTNPHDDLDPLVSAGIVAAHIKDGLALAERYHLPAVIREMIPGHHGTLVVKYFFQIAQQRGQDPDESKFRYPGPKPRSKECAIVMLADGTEASVRSLEEKNPESIRSMVDKIVGERLADGQLDDSDLTLRDVQRVKDAFCELLLGVYHERIPYPEDRIARLPQRDAAAR
ncbi:MAG: HDIG domain-containing protein [Chloroflexi bacterium]|nr:MAG: HDIG domain-containing protein [Chloroflexota bacterium]TME43512.1 MAG: HDIG domain-containing protein [Chloroflexota bacterium]